MCRNPDYSALNFHKWLPCDQVAAAWAPSCGSSSYPSTRPPGKLVRVRALSASGFCSRACLWQTRDVSGLGQGWGESSAAGRSKAGQRGLCTPPASKKPAHSPADAPEGPGLWERGTSRPKRDPPSSQGSPRRNPRRLGHGSSLEQDPPHAPLPFEGTPDGTPETRPVTTASAAWISTVRMGWRAAPHGALTAGRPIPSLTRAVTLATAFLESSPD